MANCSIPNSNLVSGRISTKSSRRSRRRNNPVASFHAPRLTGRSCPNLSRRFNAQRSTPNTQRSIQKVGRWTACSRRLSELNVGLSSSPCVAGSAQQGSAFSSIRRVKGAWWPSRSSKPSSPRKWRGRFDSYPLRQNQLRIGECGLRIAESDYDNTRT